MPGREWDVFWRVAIVLFLKYILKNVQDLAGFRSYFIGCWFFNGGEVSLGFGAGLEARRSFAILVIAFEDFCITCLLSFGESLQNYDWSC